MTTVYPGSVDTFTTKTDGVDYNLASHINDLQDSVVAVENELGADPAGVHVTVKARLDAHNHAGGDGCQIPTAGLEDASVTLAKLENNAVSNSKLADMANATVKGRNSAGSGEPEDVTMEQLAALLGIVQNIANGTYTPTVTAVANLDSVNAQSCYYVRVGSFALVWGGYQADPTAAGTTTRLRLSLPIASSLTVARQLMGFSARAGNVEEQGIVQGNTTNNEAEIYFTATATANHNLQFWFAYAIA